MVSSLPGTTRSSVSVSKVTVASRTSACILAGLDAVTGSRAVSASFSTTGMRAGRAAAAAQREPVEEAERHLLADPVEPLGHLGAEPRRNL